MLDLTGKIALVTGASRGIGEATARLFADAGAKVALLARSETDICRIADEIGEAALAVPCDVASYKDVDAALNKVEGTLGPVDILINNAGVIDPIAHLSEADPIAWGQVIDINVKGVFHMMRRVVPSMVARPSRRVRPIIRSRPGAPIAPPKPVRPCSHPCSITKNAFMVFGPWACRPAPLRPKCSGTLKPRV